MPKGEITVQLSRPLTIEERINAAMKDDHWFHVLYYNRMEGATTAAKRVAMKNEDVMIVSNQQFEREFRENNIKFVRSSSLLYGKFRRHSIIIADVVTPKEIERLRHLARDIQGRLIVLKGIRSDGIDEDH